MMLADHGAEVIRVDRPDGGLAGVEIDGTRDVLLRSRRTISIDLKNPAGVEIVRKLAASADGFIEGFRPGVTERLGLGPDVLLESNPKLVYGRMTGWGQSGPYASRPGHDINYIAVSGALNAFGREGEQPTVPLNLVGDYGGGGLMLAFGMVSALLAVRGGGAGRVIDCAMAEGASLLMAGIWSLRANDAWNDRRGTNLLDSGAPFYDTYRAADGGYLAIGAIEPKFFRRLCLLIGFDDDPDFADQMDRSRWPAMRAKLTTRFAERPLNAWCDLLEQEDCCFAPVVPMRDAPAHAYNIARKAFLEVDGVVQPVPAPRYEGEAEYRPWMWRENRDATELLAELGYDPDARAALAETGAFWRGA
jgi:alpha-methylacyl-CoA racemase